MMIAIVNQSFAWHRVCLAICVVIVGAASPFAAEGAEAKPGSLLEWTVPGLSQQVTIRFHYCPKGTIRPGGPSSSAGGEMSISSNPTPLDSFFMGETEVTLSQYRAILGEGDAGMAPLITLGSKQKENQEYEKVLRAGQSEPAFFVPLEGAVDFCRRLQEQFDKTRPKNSLETRTFRLPSHLEWQYAARAIASAEKQNERPHFARWVRMEDLSQGSQEKCRDVWKYLQHPTAFPGTQADFLELNTAGGPDQIKQVGEILKEAFGIAFGPSSGKGSILPQPSPVKKTNPNDWYLYDIHEGVSEWTLWASTTETGRDHWARLSESRQKNQPLDGTPGVFLAGGGFTDRLEGAKALYRFTVWGGPKLDDNTKKPQGFDYTPDLVENYTPGFRVLMEYSLIRDWLLVMRQAIYSDRGSAESANDFLKRCDTSINQLAVADDHPARAALKFYSALNAQNRRQSLPEVLRELAKASSKKATGGKVKLENLLGQNTQPPSEPPKTELSDEQAYFEVVAGMLANR